jgi:hypothetical protein
VVTVTAAYDGEWLWCYMVSPWLCVLCNCFGACAGGAGLLLEEYVVTVTAACNGRWLPTMSLPMAPERGSHSCLSGACNGM